MNVTLIGMAGAGKSYIGKRLADRLGHTFLDIDSVLEEMHGEKLEKILEELGDEKFIETEEKAIISATSGKDRHVFSPAEVPYTNRMPCDILVTFRTSCS